MQILNCLQPDVFFASNDIVLIYAAAILLAIGNGLMWPSLMSLLSKRAGAVGQESVQGVASSFGRLASIIGLITGGLMHNSIGATTFLISAGIIFPVFTLSFQPPKIKSD